MNRRKFLFGIPAAAVAATVAVKAVAEAPAATLGDLTALLKNEPLMHVQPMRYHWHNDLRLYHDSEALQKLLHENMQTLKRSFEENFDLMVYR